MPTTNPVVSTVWTKVADASDTHFVVTSLRRGNSPDLEYAMTAADVAPSGIAGQPVSNDEVLTRDVCGEGFLWVRVSSAVAGTTMTLAVTK